MCCICSPADWIGELNYTRHLILHFLRVEGGGGVGLKVEIQVLAIWGIFCILLWCFSKFTNRCTQDSFYPRQIHAVATVCLKFSNRLLDYLLPLVTTSRQSC